MAQSDDLLKLLGDTLTPQQPSGTAPAPAPVPAAPVEQPKSKSDDLLDLLKDPTSYRTPDEKERDSAPGLRERIKDEAQFVGTQLQKGVLQVGTLPNTIAQVINKGRETETGKELEAAPDPEGFAQAGKGFGELMKNWPSYEAAHDLVYNTAGYKERDPQGPIEDIAGGALRAAPAGVLAGPAGVGMAALGGASGEVAAKMAPEHPDAARFIGSLVGPLGLSTVTSLAGKGVAAVRNAAIKANSVSLATAGVLRDAEDIGVSVPKYMATDSEWAPRTAVGLQKVPGAGQPISKSAETAGEQLGQAAETTRLGYGSSTRRVSGKESADAITDWITTGSKDTLKTFYNEVDADIARAQALPKPPPVTVVGGPSQPIPNAKAAPISDRGRLLKTKEIAQDIEDERTEAGLPPSSAVAMVRKQMSDDFGNGQGMSYPGAKTLRTHIREMIDGDTLIPPGMSNTELERIHGGLTQDLRPIIRRVGGADALASFDKANSVARAFAARRDQLVKIVGVRGDAPGEQVFDKLISLASSKTGADIKKLALARKAMGPDAMNNVASAHIRRMGFDATGKFSPDRFLTQWDSLSDSGKAILFRSGGHSDLADSLEKIANVSRQFKDRISKFANTSKTSDSLVSLGTLAEGVRDPVTTLTMVFTGRQLAKYLSRPATAKAIANWSANYNRVIASPSLANRNAYIGATSALYNESFGREDRVGEDK